MAQRMTGWQTFDAARHDVDEVAPLYLANGQQTNQPLAPGAGDAGG